MTTPDLHVTPDGSADVTDLFSAERRRHAVAVLSETDAPLALADLAREVLRRERDAPVATIDHDDLRQCQVMLYHVHAPKLADAGLVEFDTDRRTVALAE